MKKEFIKKRKGENLSRYRKTISVLAKNVNKELRYAREQNLTFLSKRWEAVLDEIGTIRKKEFRVSTSRMNTSQLQEYASLLYSFEEEYQTDLKYRERVAEAIGNEYLDIWNSMEKTAENIAYDYFIPSEQEHTEVMTALRDTVTYLNNNDEAMQTLGREQIIRNILDLMKQYGENQDNRILHTNGKSYGNHMDFIAALNELKHMY